MLDISVLENLKFLRPADAAAKWENATLLVVERVSGRRVGDAQGTVDAMAVLHGRRLGVSPVDNVVTRSAEVVRAPAAVQRD